MIRQGFAESAQAGGRRRQLAPAEQAVEPAGQAGSMERERMHRAFSCRGPPPWSSLLGAAHFGFGDESETLPVEHSAPNEGRASLRGSAERLGDIQGRQVLNTNPRRRGSAAVIPVSCGDRPVSPPAAPVEDGVVRRTTLLASFLQGGRPRLKRLS